MITQLTLLTSFSLMVAPLLAEKMDSNLRPLISKEEIASKIKEAACQINHEYASKDLVIVMVMKGALLVTADLIRELDIPLDLEYVQCSSYGARGTERGDLQVIGLDRLNIHNRDVLLVDDVFDSGHTLSSLVEALKEKGPKSIRTFVLLSKAAKRDIQMVPDYTLFHIQDEFIVGYGLDYKERYRGLDGVYILEDTRDYR